MAEASPRATIRSFTGWLGRIRAHEDPRVAAANLVALVLAWNTPFYPLYLLWAVGHDAFPSGLLTLLSFPIWAAVPWLAPRHPLAARLLLPIGGVANIVFCSWIFGEASGDSLFLIPTTILAAMLFHSRERWIRLALTCLPLVLYFGLSGRYGAPLQPYTDAENIAMVRLNAGSVGTFSIFLGLLFSGMVEDAPNRR
jgi:hypothetical protein